MAKEMCRLGVLETIRLWSWMVMRILCYFLMSPNPIYLNRAVYSANYVDNRQRLDGQMFQPHLLAYYPIDLLDQMGHCIVPIKIEHNLNVLQTPPGVMLFDLMNKIKVIH